MKNMIVTFALFGTFACVGNAPMNSENNSSGASGSIISANVKVKDGNNTVLGYVTEGDDTSITLLTITGWYVSLYYDGTNVVNTVFFSGAGCTGTAYRQTVYPVMYGKSLIYDGVTYYKPSNIGANNTSPSTSQSYASNRGPSGTCNASVGTQNMVTLTTATRTESGLPASITLPIQLEGQ